ncbi:MAG: isochorismatase family protein [Thermomicrobiales bacterium]|nr:isochorismatase family protein [Thermomicrobiales bacterium]
MSNGRSQHHSLANQDLREQYLAAGFAGRVGWGKRPAVLVIDMAGAWTTPGEQLGSNLQGVAGQIARILDVARQRGDVPVYFTTMAYDPEMRELGEIVRRKTPHTELMVRGSDRVQLIPDLGRRPNEPFFEKPRASAFFGTNLLSMLISERVDTAIVVGCSTSGCIRSTAESAFNNNFHVIVPAEAVGDRSWSAHEGALFDIDARFGDVVSVEDVLAHLRGEPARAEARQGH